MFLLNAIQVAQGIVLQLSNILVLHLHAHTLPVHIRSSTSLVDLRKNSKHFIKLAYNDSIAMRLLEM